MREYITTGLELAGLLMLTAAAMALALVAIPRPWCLPTALLVGAVLLLASSALIVSRAAPPKPREEPGL
jgi:hypothetical protein